MTRERKIYKVTLAGSVGNLALLVFKFVAGIAGHSAAMIADAIHSLSDFITDLVVLIFVRISSKPQDKSHAYGHGKFETFATFIIGIVLVAVAGGVMLTGIERVIAWCKGETLELPEAIALWAALISIVVKELLYRYTAASGKQLNSQALAANAWHHRSDALSSIAAALGIGGAILFGKDWAVLDPIASIMVSVLLVRVAGKLLKQSVGELTEETLPEATEREIYHIVSEFPDVSEPHNLRTRRIGHRIAIEIHVRMNGDITLRKAHDIATDIEARLKERFGVDTHVSVHMEPTKSSV